MRKEAKRPDADWQLKWLLSQMAEVKARFLKKQGSVQLRLNWLVPREKGGDVNGL